MSRGSKARRRPVRGGSGLKWAQFLGCGFLSMPRTLKTWTGGSGGGGSEADVMTEVDTQYHVVCIFGVGVEGGDGVRVVRGGSGRGRWPLRCQCMGCCDDGK